MLLENFLKKEIKLKLLKEDLVNQKSLEQFLSKQIKSSFLK